MDAWVERALAKWPNVPALFGWLGLSRRGQWLIQGERISHPRIVDTIARNYGVDEHGRWFFQNGPQRGYIALEHTPLVLRADAQGGLLAHTGQAITAARGLVLDEQAQAVLDTSMGAGSIDGADLDWVLERLEFDGDAVTDTQLAEALAAPDDSRTALMLHAFGQRLPVYRCDVHALEQRLGFVRDPQPVASDG